MKKPKSEFGKLRDASKNFKKAQWKERKAKNRLKRKPIMKDIGGEDEYYG